MKILSKDAASRSESVMKRGVFAAVALSMMAGATGFSLSKNFAAEAEASADPRATLIQQIQDMQNGNVMTMKAVVKHLDAHGIMPISEIGVTGTSDRDREVGFVSGMFMEGLTDSGVVRADPSTGQRGRDGTMYNLDGTYTDLNSDVPDHLQDSVISAQLTHARENVLPSVPMGPGFDTGEGRTVSVVIEGKDMLVKEDSLAMLATIMGDEPFRQLMKDGTSGVKNHSAMERALVALSEPTLAKAMGLTQVSEMITPGLERSMDAFGLDPDTLPRAQGVDPSN